MYSRVKYSIAIVSDSFVHVVLLYDLGLCCTVLQSDGE
jgi:hypothetical protein